jgi:hypothetical protein
MSNPVDPARTAPEQEGQASDPAVLASVDEQPSHIGR